MGRPKASQGGRDPHGEEEVSTKAPKASPRIYRDILEWTRNKIVAEFCWTCGLMDLSCMFRHQVRATIFVELVD